MVGGLLCNERSPDRWRIQPVGSRIICFLCVGPFNVHDAHSIYFEVLGENGFIALFLFLAIGILSLAVANSNIKKTERIEELKWANDLSHMVFVSIIAYAADGMFLGMAYFNPYYHLVAILVLVQRVIKSRLSRVELQVRLCGKMIHRKNNLYRNLFEGPGSEVGFE